MKQSVLKFMLFLITFCTTNLVANAEEMTVETASEFSDAVRNHPTAYIRLKADIDLTTISRISKKFQGTIDGEDVNEEGQTIFHSLGYVKDPTKTDNKRVNHPIFEHIEGATLKNLVIQNFRIEWDDDEIGAVAYTAKNCKFNQVVISEVSIFNDDDEAGAIVGKAENCDFRCVRAMGNDMTVDGKRAGGLVGLSYNSIYCDCSNSAFSTVYADGSWGNAYAGGFVGESNSDQFVFCVNFASIGALDDRVGGIAGYSAKSYFTNCTNGGFVMHCEEDEFLSTTKKIKKNIEDNLKEKYLTAIQETLEEKYHKQDFDLSVGFASFLGTIGLSAAAFAIDLCLLSVTTCGIGAFTATIIIAAVGIVVTLINLIDAEIGAHDEIGGICGTCESGVFDACSNYGTILCIDSYSGGIVGLMREIGPKNQIINCLNAGVVQGYENVGGIFGEANPADVITHCLNVGEIKAKGNKTDHDPIGNLSRKNVGHNMSKNFYKANSAYTGNDARTPKTTEDLENGTVAGLLNDGATSENAPWHQTIGEDEYPVLDPSHSQVDPQRHGDVFVISNLDDLKALRDSVNKGTKERYVVYINEDIDCSGETWTPIGTYEHPFAGYCDGNGHTISNLKTAEDKTKNGVGFFGIVGINTEVRNLIIGSGEIYGGNGVGAIIGYAEHIEEEGYIKIIGCGNAANINANYDSGGLIGTVYSNRLFKLTIDNCYNMGNINATEKSAAICGFGKENVLVTSCWNTGKVSGYIKDMGFVRADSKAALEIHNCYNIDKYPELLQTDKDIQPFSSEEAKNGTLCYKLNGGSNDTSVGLMWEQDITSNSAYPIYKGYTKESKGIYTSRNVTGIYGTVVLPYTVTSDDNIKYYTLTDVVQTNSTQLHFHSVTTLPAGTPAIFRVVKPDMYEFISTEHLFSEKLSKVVYGDWTMTGNLNINRDTIVFTNQNELATLYYISGDQIKSATSRLTISPFRAYLIGPSRTSAAAPALDIVFDDPVPTGISSLLQLPQGGENGYSSSSLGGTEGGLGHFGDSIYNLAGQRLTKPQKGVNIIKGKKIIR